METLLLEIGSEEIPAGYIEPALKAMASHLAERLTAARIDFGAMKTFGTPRRLALLAADVADRQRTVSSEVLGPPAKIGYDEKGVPTMAARKFAQKVGISVDRLKIRQTAKGSYLCATVTERGRATRTVLKKMLPEVILSIPFPKTMRWADLDLHFARPILYVTALLGRRTVPFRLETIQSGPSTRGHSFMNPGRIKLRHPDEYISALRDANVIADIAERRQVVAEAIARAAASKHGRVLRDDALLDIVTNLVERPFATAGKFDDAFLTLPREILITAMREHQKYFAVVDSEGRLKPFFVAVNNTRTRDPELVARGHERVLRARLADAKFFYESDLKTPFDTWSQKLEGVLFQAQLGSMQAKVERVMSVGAHLAETLSLAPAAVQNVKQAARLCKTDLVSQVVVEFPKLQGVMGRIYAAVRQEPVDVASAVEEHYRPTHSGGALPQTTTGAVLAVADKMDTICACFSVGLAPTGASDPYALRRQGIGIVHIMRQQQMAASLPALIRHSISRLESRRADTEATAEAVYDFIKRRMSRLLVEEGYDRDVVAAIVDADAQQVPDVWQRTAALQKRKGAADFEALATAFKRVVNIIRKAEETQRGAVDESRFEDPAESELLAAGNAVKEKVAAKLKNGRYEDVLIDISRLRGPVDRYFENVLVMAEDPVLRANRLALLADIAGIFESFADFSKIST